MADPRQDLHERCLQGVAKTIRTLNLRADNPPGNVGQNVFAQVLPDAAGVKYPLILVTAEGAIEEELDGTFESEEVLFPAQVLILDREPSAKLLPVYLKWRQLIARHFRRKVVSIAEAPEVYDFRLSSRLVLDREAPIYKLVRSGLTVGCVAQYPRQEDEE